MPGPADDQPYAYPTNIGEWDRPLQPPAQASYPGLDDPSMQHWTDPNSAWYQMPKPPPERNIVPLDEAMAGTQAPLIPGRPPAEPIQPPASTEPVQPPAWMPEDPATQSRTTYAPEDLDRNGIVTEIERWLFHQQSNPEEREQRWLEENVWSQGNTVDGSSGMIIDGRTGQPLGQMPSFE